MCTVRYVEVGSAGGAERVSSAGAAAGHALGGGQAAPPLRPHSRLHSQKVAPLHPRPNMLWWARACTATAGCS